MILLGDSRSSSIIGNLRILSWKWRTVTKILTLSLPLITTTGNFVV